MDLKIDNTVVTLVIHSRREVEMSALEGGLERVERMLHNGSR